jgi:hypothetical protein
MGLGKWLKRAVTPPKSIRKFQLKKLGNASWWKDFAKQVALPAAAGVSGLGVLGIGPLSGALGGVGGALKGAASSVGGALKGQLGSLGKQVGMEALGMGGGEGGGGGISGFLGGDLGKLLMGGLTGASTYGNYKQSKKDSKQARQIAEQAMQQYQMAGDHAANRWQSMSPLRNAFMQGAFNMADPTNPFSRGQMFQQMAPGGLPLGQKPDIKVGTPTATDPPGGDQPFTPRGMLMGQMGGRALGQPQMRAASVKAPYVARAQDRGRDRMDEDMEMRRR